MKKLIPFLSIAVLMTACTADVKNSEATAVTPVGQQAPAINPTDTMGLAQFQNWKAQNELAATEQYEEPVQYAAAPVKKAQKAYQAPVRKATKKTVAPVRKTSAPAPASSGSDNTVSSGTEDVAVNSESANEAKEPAKEKVGWSKAAKGAVIGGAGGAAAGAVIYKKNRAVGAVIGGVLGGAGGYVLGRKMDKKDGRN